MAALSENDRVVAYRALMERMGLDNEPQPLTKADLRAAVDAADDWVNANAASFNSALPSDIRSALSSRQKALLLVYVVSRRFEIL